MVRWLAAIVESSDDAILGKSLEGIIISWNAGATRVFGYEADEAIGQHISFLAWPGEEEQIESSLDQLRRGEHVEHCEVIRRHKSGRKMFVSISLSPVRDHDGKIIGIAKIAREVPNQREVAERRAAEVLRQRDVAERDARHKLAEHEIQVRQEYMSMLSHELRTPLHTIIGFAELLAEESIGRLNPKQQKYLNHIQDDAAHFLVLINDMLDLGRMETGGFKLNLESLSVRDAVSDTVEAIRPFAESKSVTVRIGNILDLHAFADPTRLRQILFNLLSNAVKFAKAGGEVYVDGAVEGDLITITVGDDGIGISPEDRAHIFDKFYQAAGTAAGGQEASGLGLPICRQLVELQGGTIWVESELQKGSRFHFTLPTCSNLLVAGAPSSLTQKVT